MPSDNHAPRIRWLRLALLAPLAVLVAVQADRLGVALGSHWSRVDNPARDRWELTMAIERALALAPGQKVADVGAGSGYFSMRIARAVGPTGHVVATEVSPWSLLAIRWHAWRKALEQVEAKPAELGSVAPGVDFDRVLLLNVFPFDACKPELNRKLLHELTSALRPGGRAVLVHDTLRRKGVSRDGACADPKAEELLPLLDSDVRVVIQDHLDLQVPAEFEPGYLLVLERGATAVAEAVSLPSSGTRTATRGPIASPELVGGNGTGARF